MNSTQQNLLYSAITLITIGSLSTGFVLGLNRSRNNVSREIRNFFAVIKKITEIESRYFGNDRPLSHDIGNIHYDQTDDTTFYGQTRGLNYKVDLKNGLMTLWFQDLNVTGQGVEISLQEKSAEKTIDSINEDVIIALLELKQFWKRNASR